VGVQIFRFLRTLFETYPPGFALKAQKKINCIDNRPFAFRNDRQIAEAEEICPAEKKESANSFRYPCDLALKCT